MAGQVSKRAGAGAMAKRLDFGERVFIIGGGPSALGAPFELMAQHGHVMAVNDSFLHCPANSVVSMDGRWMSHRIESVLDKGLPFYGSLKHFSKWMKELAYRDGLHLFSVDPKPEGMSENAHPVFGNCSGNFAVNLAYLARPKEIYLFGFDSCLHPEQVGKAEHWYGNYPWRPERKGWGHMLNWARWHDQARMQFDRAGIKVFNVSKISNIRAYERMSLGQFQNHFRELSKSQ